MLKSSAGAAIQTLSNTGKETAHTEKIKKVHLQQPELAIIILTKCLHLYLISTNSSARRYFLIF